MVSVIKFIVDGYVVVGIVNMVVYLIVLGFDN